MIERAGSSSALHAVEVATQTVVWSHRLSGTQCFGLAVMSSFGVIFAITGGTHIEAIRVVDGSLICRFPSHSQQCFAATDSISGILFSGSRLSPYCVTSWAWVPDGMGGRGELVCQGPVEAAGTSNGYHPLAVMPPAVGKTTSYLVVGTLSKPELRVIALPSLMLVHTHVLEGMRVRRLAADPMGRALAIGSYSSDTIRVLAWPLRGMPPLE